MRWAEQEEMMAGDNQVVEAIAEAVREHIAGGFSLFTDVSTGDHTVVLRIGDNITYIMNIRQVVRA